MEYKLPPLPTFEEWCRIISPSEPGTQIASVENFVKAYAIAAIEAQGVPDVGSLLNRLIDKVHRKGELWERCQGKGWPEAESDEFAKLRDEAIPAIVAQLQRALASAPPAPQAERKPLFADLIAKHDGLSEELKAIDAQVDKEHGQASEVQQEPVAWIRPSGKAMLEAGGYCTVYASDGMSNHSTPLYTHPAQQAKPKPITEQELKAGREAVTDDPDEQPDPWSFRMGAWFAERHHGIKE